MRFLLDENLPRAVGELLMNSGHDVLAVATSSLRGATDEQLWIFAAQESRVFLPRDLGFPIRRVHPAPPGLVLVRAPDDFSSSRIVGLLQQFLGSAKDEDIEGAITVVSPGRVRSRPL